jgi:four helix bundle protein
MPIFERNLYMALKHYRELIVWQKAVELVVVIYRITTKFPHAELYGLTSQIRRAAISIPSNIAEGQGRNTTRDFIHFLSIAHGSLKEMETQVIISQRLGFIEDKETSSIIESTNEIGRLISGLSKALKKKSSR